MDEQAPADVDALIEESGAVQRDANRLLRELRLVEQLQRYGEVELAGAYRWDLMLEPDLDLYVVNATVGLDLVLDAFNHFVRCGDFLWFALGDTVRAKPEWEVPKGYYLGMSREFNGRRWKVETWFLRSPQPVPTWIDERMTEAGRRRILQLKELKRTGDLPISSYSIYRAVLFDDVGDAASMRAWLERQQASSET